MRLVVTMTVVVVLLLLLMPFFIIPLVDTLKKILRSLKRIFLALYYIQKGLSRV